MKLNKNNKLLIKPIGTGNKDDKSKIKRNLTETKPVNLFGCLKDTIKIQRDIIEPIYVIWEANK